MAFKVQVTTEWRSQTTFEFDTQEGADKFRDAVNAGNAGSLQAMEEDESNELDSHNSELINWEAGKVRAVGVDDL